MNAATAFVPRFEAWLLRETGIDASSLGINAVERAVLERVRVTRLGLAAHDTSVAIDPAEIETYWQQLTMSRDERQGLIEALVVPETWFYRDREAYVALARLANERLVRDPMHVLRVLSLPCSTGEEPYTVAMTLLDDGIGENRFTVDAFDISARVIEHARAGLYGRNSFRGHPLAFRDRHFTALNDSWQLSERVRETVRFSHANLFDLQAGAQAPYDFIFCRNVLIYFDREAQDRAIRVLDANLANGGTIFVGPAETGLMMRHAMTSARIPLAFAFRRSTPEETNAARAVKPLALSAANVTTTQAARTPAFTAATRAPAKPPFANRALTPPPARTQQTVRAPTPQPAAEPSLAAARRHADAGEFDEAERLAHQHAIVHGPNVDAFHLLGLIADARGRSADAADFYRKALYLDPAHYEALTHLAALLDIGGDRAGAQNLMQRAQRSAARAAQSTQSTQSAQVPTDDAQRSRGFHAARRS
ncbi:UNVERIFIED_ORG: chemotaxis protein methyltransferase WspC [Burkholderia sp. CF145]|uniref:CheR family methyltransferase n=1 Tax=Paraburkholderia hospita TaxID=169430 RepID=UPI0002719D49|nr:CheR family methyltransferase [Paraburkholderia hospita]EUC18902.1 MCP methyltransferase, CheR-type [Burkholderia sp. BT03]SKC66464.1 Methylase of chemotaxis methyl-accepting proteins [Paraburkholderia hospita]